MSSSTTVRTARRRTLRIAAAALTAAAGLTLTACAGSDAADAKSASHASSAAGEATASGWSGLQSTDAKAVVANKQSGQQAGSARTANGGKAASPVRTQRLADGISKAEIYKLGDQHYRAKIVARGSVLATLETKGHDDGLDANDMFVTLTLDGQVHSWMGGGHQGPGTFKLAGGWTAKVTKIGELRYRAQIIGHDGVAATLETNQHDVGLNANGIYIVLSNGGVISAHA
ncbi:hypothetical protein [Streptomyces tubercidicus]|uniref:Lipoprotein n=1 Tax=Streptomyces tubercidicus TaxID=47759 RepID=A0A640UI20_9ACTN|nr:hypothetical protein [Streptomyces tubercidicus]WAU10582.1 hypothetical protein STRTU_000679 [Streptomyces tubercidicus]GFE35698.1 hypothetical protein Stube_03710 [Streptomyces tubercidicus]